jgi:fused signal recognition particle receptor
MVVGVNGAGKTTSIGKLAHQFKSEGQKVVLAAGDTFRAAAREQLMTWGERNGVDVISQTEGDPAAVAFDAVKAGQSRGADVVIVDTAGRLPTQLHLMEELKKVKRVVAKAMTDAPHEIWLVVDGGTGQNALVQAKAFDEALGLTGLVVTKLDGTAKGGVLLALAAQKPIAVQYIGVGERIEDLQVFNPNAFASALVD